MIKWLIFLPALLFSAEPITRQSTDFRYTLKSPATNPAPTYSWEENTTGEHPKITKEHFRCRGSHLNPPRVEYNDFEGTVTYDDCGGSTKHSLPIRDQKEFIYPILLDLLNHVQAKTGKKVVVTSGHRCPEHNSYVDPSAQNQTSKHQIGAEVSFYVQGLEEDPQTIVNILIDYYQEPFKRYEKSDTNVSTPPWYNKEIFIKLFKRQEGRNFDNRHPYPYIAIQVRYDRELKEFVSYSWPKAHRSYHRR